MALEGIKLVPDEALKRREVLAKHIAGSTQTLIPTRRVFNHRSFKINESQACMLIDNSGSTPVSLSVAAQRLVGRITGGTIAALTAAQVITLLQLPLQASARSVLDLSAAAASNVVIVHARDSLTLLSVMLLYTETSSADVGVTVTVGKETDNDYYYTGTSESSKALWYDSEPSLLATDIAAGDTVICGCAGGKTGTGEILVCIEYCNA